MKEKPPSKPRKSKLSGIIYELFDITSDASVVPPAQPFFADVSGSTSPPPPPLPSPTEEISDPIAIVRSIAKVTKAIALADLSKQIEVRARNEILDLKSTVNVMVVHLCALAAEVTQVTLDVGSQGKLGGQANVPNVESIWFKLVRSVNSMSSSITGQVRSITTVKTAIAGGDLTQKIEM
ncbi:histidine kinase osmosensor [Marasmius sp. AFHP31]|nr:histidine kinase osmosensor [Marasmius sp. AFHP31]